MAGGEKWANFTNKLFPNQGKVAGNLLTGVGSIFGKGTTPGAETTPTSSVNYSGIIIAGVCVLALVLILKK